MSKRKWFALYRPGREEPEAADFDRSDLVSVALRRGGVIRPEHYGQPSSAAPRIWRCREMRVGKWVSRDAAWKRLRRRGWRIEPLPERFWEAGGLTNEYLGYQVASLRKALARERALSRQPSDLLREVAEDRHSRLCSVGHGVAGRPTSTLRTCSDRLCDEVAQLKGGS